VGYEGQQGIGNRVVIVLEANGTDTSPQIDSDRIGAAYLSVGSAFRFRPARGENAKPAGSGLFRPARNLQSGAR